MSVVKEAVEFFREALGLPGSERQNRMTTRRDARKKAN